MPVITQLTARGLLAPRVPSKTSLSSVLCLQLQLQSGWTPSTAPLPRVTAGLCLWAVTSRLLSRQRAPAGCHRAHSFPLSTLKNHCLCGLTSSVFSSIFSPILSFFELFQQEGKPGSCYPLPDRVEHIEPSAPSPSGRSRSCDPGRAFLLLAQTSSAATTGWMLSV